MKLLVTGGAGFIGSNFILYILNKYPSYQIINIDLLTYAGNLENLRSIHHNDNHRFVKADISDRLALEPLFQEGLDVVINFAAETHVDRSILHPDIFVRTNILGTQTLLDLSKQYGISKFVQVSTDEVYGTLGDTGTFKEESPLLPSSPYSASKAGAELLVRSYHETFELPINITRCSNNYGPYQFPEKLIPLMIRNALKDKPLPIYGDGLNIRDWLYVEDHISAIDLVLHRGRNGELYNVGGNNERNNLQVVKTILRELGKSESLIRFVKDRPGHDRRYAIDADKIRHELGWKPIFDYESGIKQTIRWYLDNQVWMEQIESGSYKHFYEAQYKDQLEAKA